MFLSRKHGTELQFMRSCRSTFSTVQFEASTSNFIYETSRTPFFEAPHPLTRGWGLHSVTLIILLLMFCRGCMCAIFECTVQEWDRIPWYLDFSKGKARTNECLTVTESSIGDICESPKSLREQKMRETSTSFCGLPLINILSGQDKYNVKECARDRGCYDSLKAVENLDRQLSCMYHHTFVELLERRACASYSVRGTCDRCKVSPISY